MTDPSQPEQAWIDALRAQAQAADPSVSAYATANAGSGKTKVLIDRVARLLLRRSDGRPGARPDSILCLTYTRAAANEMMTRLFSRLGDWAVKEDDSLREALAGLEGRDPQSYSQADLRDARTLFARALETPGGLRIETIHAFCARILRRFPLEAGVVPGFRELEESEAARLWSAARQEAILSAAGECPAALARVTRDAMGNGASEALDSLRQEGVRMLAFAEAHDNDLASMARTLRHELQAPEETREQLLHQAMGVDLPRDILSRCADGLMQGSDNDHVRAGYMRAVLSAPTPEAAWQAYLPVFLTGTQDFRRQNPYTASAAKAAPELKAYFSIENGVETARVRRLIEDLRRADALQRTLALLQVGLPALQAYDREKTRRGALDFDDLLLRTRDLLLADGMSGWVLYKLDGQISHVLIDEAQDTSPVQWDLIRALTSEFTAGQGADRKDDPRTIFIVGDEKQSIYSFQGAEPARLRQETDRLGEMMSPVCAARMNMSFRSSPEILRFVDQVWNQANEAGAIAGPVVHTARRTSEPGYVELWPIEPKLPDEAGDTWERPVDVVRSTSPKARLAASVAACVRRMIAGQETVWESGHRRPVQPQDILILVSKRQGGLFESLIGSLKAEGVAVAGADRLVLTDFIGVQDCLNLMRFALLDRRDLTVAEILRGPFVGLVDDDRYLFPLAAGRAPGESLWSRICASQDPDIRRAALFLDQVRARADLSPFEFLSRVLDQDGPDGRTGWQKLTARLGAPARDPVEALLARALQHDASGASSIQAFVSEMETQRAEIKRDLAEAGHAVRVMTVHGAKGLQAPVVILPDTTFKPRLGGSGLLQGASGPIWIPRKQDDTENSAEIRAQRDARAAEEHRRLLYVALTRAQDRLIIAGHWSGKTSPGSRGFEAGSWYELCERAMDSLDPDVTADGRRCYGQRLQAMQGAPQRAAPQAPELPGLFLRKAPSERASRQVSAPTSLLGPRTRVLAPFDPVREARMKRGRIIHTLLQYLPELDQEQWETAAASWLARDAHLSPAQRQEIAGAALGVLRDRDLADLFGPGGRAEAAIIGRADELPAGLVINGRVDRLVITPQRVLIIDFKTDQPAPDRAEEVALTYLAQMAAYQAVMRQAYPGREVVAALCWTDGPRLMRLPEALLAGVLADAAPAI